MLLLRIFIFGVFPQLGGLVMREFFNNLAGSQLVQWNVLMAATLLAALPTLLVYIFLGRYFLRGLMAGALKG